MNIAKFLRTAFFYRTPLVAASLAARETVFFKIEIKSLRKSCEGIQFLVNLEDRSLQFSKNELFQILKILPSIFSNYC